MEGKRILKVSMSKGWTSYFVKGLYHDGREMELVNNLVFAKDEPILMDAHGAEVLDWDEDFDCWWDRAVDCVMKWTPMDKDAVRGMMDAILNGGGIITGCVLQNGGNGTLTIKTFDAPLEFDAGFVSEVLEANGGRFMDIPYKTPSMTLSEFRDLIDGIAETRPELLDKPIKVEEYWDADEPIQDVYGVDAEDGYVLINKGRN